MKLIEKNLLDALKLPLRRVKFRDAIYINKFGEKRTYYWIDNRPEFRSTMDISDAIKNGAK